MDFFQFSGPFASTAFTASVFLIASAPGALQAEPPQPRAAQAMAKTTPADARFRRLIVRFKDSAAGHTQAAPSGRERAVALNASAAPRQYQHQELTLDYLKSVAAQTHVMVSNRALSRAEMDTLVGDIAKDPQVEYAEIDERAYPHFVPNDTHYGSQQWNLQATTMATGSINLTKAWSRSTNGNPINGAGVTVAVLDSGYLPHADLVANIVPGYDFVGIDTDYTFTTANDGNGRDADPLDPGDWNPTGTSECPKEDSSWHGTRVAGVIGAVGNNTTGIIGVAYGARLLAVRVMGICGGYSSDIAAGIRWAAGLPVGGVATNTTQVAKVINLSLGGEHSCSTTYQQAITAARAAGSVVVVSTGNDNSSTLSQPANCSGVIAVTAHTRLGDRADYANYGAGTTLSAPGGGYGVNTAGDGSSIYSTNNTGLTTPGSDSYVGNWGTSFSAPQVAGVAALLFQIKPSISPDEVANYLTSTARAFPVGTYCAGNTDCGAGMLDGFKAVQALQTALNIPNSAPTMSTIAAQTVAAGGSLQFTVSANDVDADVVTFLASGVPSGASFDGATGVFQWSYALPGVYSVTITPTDGVASGTPQTVSVTVTGTLPAAKPASGGGGGAGHWADVLAALLMAASAVRLRRPAAPSAAKP